MELKGRLLASWPTMVLFAMIGSAFCLMHATAGEPLKVSFPAMAGGKNGQSMATPILSQADTVLVAVVAPGANATAPALREGPQQLTARLIGHDPISRLAFLRTGQGSGSKTLEWLSDSREIKGDALRAMVDGKVSQCHVKGSVNQVGGKVLPFALLQLNFETSEPLPGTPLLDANNRVAALYFQSDASKRVGYAIPAEAVHRVRRDIMQKGESVRGWLGFSLSSKSQSARVLRVLTDSPAALAGVMPGDILLAVGPRNVTQYADVANAFFYLVPGEPTRLRVKRGGQTLEIMVTPTRPQAESQQ